MGPSVYCVVENADQLCHELHLTIFILIAARFLRASTFIGTYIVYML